MGQKVKYFVPLKGRDRIGKDHPKGDMQIKVLKKKKGKNIGKNIKKKI